MAEDKHWNYAQGVFFMMEASPDFFTALYPDFQEKEDKKRYEVLYSLCFVYWFKYGDLLCKQLNSRISPTNALFLYPGYKFPSRIRLKIFFSQQFTAVVSKALAAGKAVSQGNYKWMEPSPHLLQDTLTSPYENASCLLIRLLSMYVVWEYTQSTLTVI